MNFLIDANLPRRLVNLFHERGYQAVHTISTGNIRNKELEALRTMNFEKIISELTNNRFVELTREHVIVHA